MANIWTAPPLWDATKAITAAKLNQLIGNDGVNPGNLNWLFARPQFYGYVGAISTTSTGFVVADSTNLQCTLTPAGTKLFAMYKAEQNGQPGQFAIQIDGVTQSPVGSGYAGTGPAWPTIFGIFTVTANVAHTLRVIFRSQTGSAMATNDNEFVVLEVG